MLRGEGNQRVCVEHFDPEVFLTLRVEASPLSAGHGSPYTPLDRRNTSDTQRDTYQRRRSPPPEEVKQRHENKSCCEISVLLTG